MKLISLIPARQGSKRLPGKNGRILGGKPLIQWTIDLAIKARRFAAVIVSTDCHNLAEIARNSGALVPWLRPAELATDTATSVDVCRHALDWYEETYSAIDGLLLLQPTSPFRRLETIRHAIDLFDGDSSVIAVDKLGNPNGLIYLATPATIRRGQLASDPFVSISVDASIEAIDIDTPDDWALAEETMLLGPYGCRSHV